MNAKPGQHARLAVIAVTHDSAHVLPDWLAAIDATGERSKMELCIADSGSSADQLKLMEEQARRRVDTFLRLPNVGFGRACNAGADATIGSILLFTNPDVRLRAIPSRALDEGLDGALLGAFGRNPDRPMGFARPPRFRDEAQKLALGAWLHPYERCGEDPAWVSGAALMIERSAFRRVGGFSSDFFMYFEDADLCARHRRSGGKVELDPGFIVEHGAGKSTADGRRRSLATALDAVNRLSARRFAQRHGRRWHAPVLYLLLALAYVPRRVLLGFARERRSPREVADYVACLLHPRRALSRLGAAEPETR